MCPQYHYRATDWSGQKHRGRLSALNPKELQDYLQAKGLTAVDIKEDKGLLRKGSPIYRLWEQLRFGRVGSRDFMIFCNQFATMIRAGLSALYALQALAGQTAHAAFRRQLEEVGSSLSKGNSLTESFRRQTGFFPAILIHMVEAGEAGGVLDLTLERLSEHFERQHDLDEKIRSATLYPLFITAVAAIVMVVMVLFVLPQFAQVFDTMGLELPRFTSLMLQGGVWVRRHWLIPAVLLLMIFGGLRWYFATEEGRLRFDRARFRLPFFGTLYYYTLMARFSRIMGVLLGSGLNLITALDLANGVLGNQALSLAIRHTRESVAQGQPLAEQLKTTGMFPPLLLEMARVGEASGTLEETFNRTAALYERDISFKAARLGSMLEPVLLLLVGLFVGLLVFSIISPMYQIFEII